MIVNESLRLLLSSSSSL